MLAMFTGCLRPCLPAPARAAPASPPARHLLLRPASCIPLRAPFTHCYCCWAGSGRVVAACLCTHFRRFPADLCKTVAFFNCILHSSCKFRHQLRIRLAPCSRTPGSCFLSACLCCTIFTHLCNSCHRNAQHICPVALCLFHLEAGGASSRVPPATPTGRSRLLWQPTAFYCHRCECVWVCVLENRVSTISTLGFAHLMPSYNFHVGCFSSFHPQSCPRELRGPIKTSRRGVKCHLCIEDLRCIFQCLINIILVQFIMWQAHKICRVYSYLFMGR